MPSIGTPGTNYGWCVQCEARVELVPEPNPGGGVTLCCYRCGGPDVRERPPKHLR